MLLLLLLAFGRKGLVGQYLDMIGVVLAFQWTGAVLAAAVMAFPLMVRAIRLSVEAVDAKVEQAASTLGASPLWVFATITLPLIAPAVGSGWLLAFTLSLDDLILTQFVAGAHAEPLRRARIQLQHVERRPGRGVGRAAITQRTGRGATDRSSDRREWRLSDRATLGKIGPIVKKSKSGVLHG